jgi:hypothetical protein
MTSPNFSSTAQREVDRRVARRGETEGAQRPRVQRFRFNSIHSSRSAAGVVD